MKKHENVLISLIRIITTPIALWSGRSTAYRLMGKPNLRCGAHMRVHIRMMKHLSLSIYMYVYVYMYICMYVCIYIYIYILISAMRAHASALHEARARHVVVTDAFPYDVTPLCRLMRYDTRSSFSMIVYIYIYIHTYTYIYIYIYTYIYIHRYVYISLSLYLSLYIYIYMYIYIYIYIYNSLSLYIYLSLSLYIYIYVCHAPYNKYRLKGNFNNSCVEAMHPTLEK